ncbi:hypothetical protein FPV67DRAFT_1605454 [Lyophyllum atratum]|nr:hypothetical protein FPV67DRAFT_1605454 [Lyophyllum atratum]
MNDDHRPITSKARGICQYYTTPRGCFAGDNCKFLHTTEPPVDPSGSRPPALTPYDKAKKCKFYAEGYCKRGAKCWFSHCDPAKPEVPVDDEELCSICFEKPSIYGLLGGCSHIFCIECIRQWRDPIGKNGEVGNTKKCPMCRADCRYIIPSSRFCKDGQAEKAQVVQKYKESMSKVPCKHFAASKKKNNNQAMCPFGKDCFYQHLKDDGTPYVFKDGVERSMRTWRNSMRRTTGFGPFRFVPGDDVDPRTPFIDLLPEAGSSAGDLNAFNMAETIAMDLFDHMVAHVNAGRGRRRGGRGRRSRENFREDLDRVRMEMVAGAVTAVREELHRRDGPTIRPFVVSGTLAPSSWDLDGDGEEVDNGWGWNDLLTDATHNGSLDDMERLELLANHMLGSTRTVRDRDIESSPPPLEPIGRQDTPPPPLIPIERERVDDDDDEMPPLESVSNSSESEDEGGNYDQESDYEPISGGQRMERPLDLLDLTHSEEARSAPVRSGRDVIHTHENEEANDDADDEDGAEVQDNTYAYPQDTELEPVTASTPIVAEPPFVTDGRGRVVWSNKDAAEETSPEPSAEPQEAQARAAGSRSLLGRVFDAFMY